MTLGDVLEILGAGILAGALHPWLGWSASLIVVALYLLYEAQCTASVRLPRTKAREKVTQAKAQLDLALRTPGFPPDELRRLHALVAQCEREALPRWRRPRLPSVDPLDITAARRRRRESDKAA